MSKLDLTLDVLDNLQAIAFLPGSDLITYLRITPNDWEALMENAPFSYGDAFCTLVSATKIHDHWEKQEKGEPYLARLVDLGDLLIDLES
jgi:hypothetical protein